MKTLEFMNGMSTGPLSGINKPELLARFLVRNHPPMPAAVKTGQTQLVSDIEQYARIRAVGVGPMGAKMVQILSRNLPDDITCHEVIFNQMGEGSEEMTALISSVRESDLLFILTGFDDEFCGAAARAVGHSAREAGVTTFTIIPDDKNISQLIIAELLADDIDILSVSECSLTDEQDLTQAKIDALTGFSMRHIVTRLTNLICYQSLISTYGADREATLQKGCICRLGVGVALGQSKGRNAATLALKRLENQGLSILEAAELIVIVEMSSYSYVVDDWNDACEVIHDNVVEGTSVLISLEMNDLLGFTDEIKVTVMVAQ